MGAGELAIGPDGVGVSSWTWEEVRRLLAEVIGRQVGAHLDASVDVLGLRVLTPDGVDIALEQAVWLAGFRSDS